MLGVRENEMSGLEYFLLKQVLYSKDHPQGWDKFIYDDESIHYGLLQILLEDSPEFARSLLGLKAAPGAVSVTLKPDNGIFDLRVTTDGQAHFIEVKVWAALSHDQFDRQMKYLESNNGLAHYILFTKAADQWSSEDIASRSNGASQLIGIKQLLTIVSAIPSKETKCETVEVARAYEAVLKDIERRW